MLVDVFKSANEVFHISDSISNPEEFCKFSDTILDVIKFTDDERLNEAKKMLAKIERRDIYKMVHNEIVRNQGNEEEVIKKYESDEYIIHFMKIGYKKNQVDNIYFYDYKNPSVSFQIKKSEVNMMFPDTFYEESFRVFKK